MTGVFPHPSLTPQQAEALTILAEEACEVAQECSKILRSGPDFCRRGRNIPNRGHLTIEVTDFLVLLAVVGQLGLIDDPASSDDLVAAKIAKMKEWTNLGDIAEEALN